MIVRVEHSTYSTFNVERRMSKFHKNIQRTVRKVALFSNWMIGNSYLKVIMRICKFNPASCHLFFLRVIEGWTGGYSMVTVNGRFFPQYPWCFASHDHDDCHWQWCQYALLSCYIVIVHFSSNLMELTNPSWYRCRIQVEKWQNIWYIYQLALGDWRCAHYFFFLDLLLLRLP